jgi:hypothetical protein
MKACVGVDVFLTSALARDEWSASRPDCFTSEERAPGTHWIEGWVGPRAGLDDGEIVRSQLYKIFECSLLGPR